jgi:LacI family transcriptional regulator
MRRRPAPRTAAAASAARHRSVTIRDVAREASVSVATVSRVLNGIGPVHSETERRIRAAARRLRYVPHGGARSLITRRTQTIGVLLPDLYGEFFSELIRGIDAAARRAGFHLIVSGSHGDRRETEEMARAMRGRVDGLVVLVPDVRASALRECLPEHFPVVLLNNPGPDGFDSVRVDNFGGAAAVVRHLAGLGHRRIAFVGGPPGNHDATERLRGYRRALKRAGLAAARELELPGDFREEAGYRACRAILALDPAPTAVFAANDAMAIGFLYACREAGVSVPNRIAIAGFDDIPIARFVTPPLTSVRVPISELGTRAADAVLERISAGSSRAAGREVVLPATLVVRASCGGRPSPAREASARKGGGATT